MEVRKRYKEQNLGQVSEFQISTWESKRQQACQSQPRAMTTTRAPQAEKRHVPAHYNWPTIKVLTVPKGAFSTLRNMHPGY